MHRSLLLLTAALVAAPAFGQEADDRDDVIVVTAARAALPASELAPRLDVLDRSAIEAGNLVSLADALGRTPAMQAVQTGALGAQASVFTRGTNSNHTLVLYDGIRLNDASAPAGAFDFGQDTIGDAARIEAVRGPLSSVYGSDAVGGVVNIIPRLGGDDRAEWRYDLAVGELDTRRVLGGVSGASDRIAYALSAEAFETDGFDQVPDRFALSTGDRDGGRSATLTGIAELQATERLSLDALVRHREAESEFDSFGAGPSFSQRGDDPDLEISQNDYTVWRLGAAAAPAEGFESRIRVGEVEIDRAVSDGGAVTDAYASDRRFAEWLNVWRPSGAGGADALITFGLQAESETITVDAAFNDSLAREEDRLGGFLVGHAGVGERLFVTASARHDDFEGFGAVTTGGLGFVLDVPEAALQLTASAGTSFRAPSMTERFAESVFQAPNPDLEPEEGESWEIGVRTSRSLAGRQGAVRAGASYHETDVDDLIEFTFDPATFLGINENVGRAEISGYEAYVEVEPAAWGVGRVSYAYTDARNADTGERLARRAAHVWSASMDVAPHERVRLGAAWTYVGRRYDTNYDDDGFFIGSGLPIDGFETVRLTAQFELGGGAEVYATLENALEEVYEQPDAFAGAPRALTIGVRGSF